MQNTLKDGWTEKQFIENLTPTLQKLGWWGKQIIVDSGGNAEVAQFGSPRRLKTIFRTNLQSAYMSGRFKNMMAARDTHPYWMYRAILDARTRAAHRALDGMVFHVDDPFTGVGFPPNGHNCRCRDVPMTEARLKRKGITPTDTSNLLETREVDAGIDKRTGEIRKTTQTGFYIKGIDGKKIWVGPDVGFNSSPLGAHTLDEVLVKRAAELSGDAALDQVRKVVLSEPRMQAWRGFVNNTLEYGKQQKQTMTVGVMQRAELDYAKAKHAVFESPIIFIQDSLLVSPKAKRHTADGDALSVDEWLVLPETLAAAEMAVWDTEEQTVVYLLPGQAESRLAVRFGRLKSDGVPLPDTATVFHTPKAQFDAYIASGRYEKIR
nr:phage minor head protein [Methylomonas koyamae]